MQQQDEKIWYYQPVDGQGQAAGQRQGPCTGAYLARLCNIGTINATTKVCKWGDQTHQQSGWMPCQQAPWYANSGLAPQFGNMQVGQPYQQQPQPWNPNQTPPANRHSGFQGNPNMGFHNATPVQQPYQQQQQRPSGGGGGGALQASDWYFCDRHSGKKDGPFSYMQMHQKKAQGHFHDDCAVYSDSDKMCKSPDGTTRWVRWGSAGVNCQVCKQCNERSCFGFYKDKGTGAQKPYDTCCAGCLRGKKHSPECEARNKMDRSPMYKGGATRAGVSNAQQNPGGKYSPPSCKCGCQRGVDPGKTRNGRNFDTCCRDCAVSKGMKHSTACDNRNAKHVQASNPINMNPYHQKYKLNTQAEVTAYVKAQKGQGATLNMVSLIPVTVPIYKSYVPPTKGNAKHERLCFHGSPPDNAVNILQGGLKQGGSGKAPNGQVIKVAVGAVYGAGVYSSPNLDTSLGYARVGKWGNKTFFICVVNLEGAQSVSPHYVTQDTKIFPLWMVTIH